MLSVQWTEMLRKQFLPDATRPARTASRHFLPDAKQFLPDALRRDTRINTVNRGII